MNNPIEVLRAAYARLEPAGADTWNPVSRGDVELWHRVRLMIEATEALRRIPADLGSLRVLDVGSGVGRSTRLMVELGIPPENILAIDFRAEALEHARRMNPAMRYKPIASLAEWPSERFDLCIQCAAFSSLPGADTRRATARLMEESVGPQGHIFWWDSIRANSFAGGDALSPTSLFAGRTIVCSSDVSLYPTFAEAAASLPRGARAMPKILRWLPSIKTHQSILFGAVRQDCEQGAREGSR
jgi:SAM-dependent methyltransferase